MAQKLNSSWGINILFSFLFSLFLDRLKFGVVPRVLITWAVLLGGGYGIYVGVAPFLRGEVAELNYVFPLVILGVMLVWLAYVMGSAFITVAYRVAKRRELYDEWRYSLKLRSFDDYNRDNSIFLNIKWNLRTPVAVHAEVSPSVVDMNELKRITDALNSILGTPPRKAWVVDFDALQRGRLAARAIPKESHEVLEYESFVTLANLIRHIITYTAVPKGKFYDLESTPQGPKFSKAIFSNLYSTVPTSYDLQHMTEAVNRVFPAQLYRVRLTDMASLEIVRFDPESQEAKNEQLQSRLQNLVKQAASKASWYQGALTVVGVESMAGVYPTEIVLQNEGNGYLYDEEERVEFTTHIVKLLRETYGRSYAVTYDVTVERIYVTLVEEAEDMPDAQQTLNPDVILPKQVGVPAVEQPLDPSSAVHKALPKTGGFKPLPPLPKR